MSCIAIIPARGGSTRIPRKNIRLFHGKPIIAYSIEAAHESGLFGNGVFVSTDDIEIAAIAKRYGACVLMRSSEMSRDDVGTQAVTADAIDLVRQKFTDYPDPDFVCCIYPTAPLLDVSSLKFAKYELDCDDRCDYAFSVGCNPLQDAGQFYFGKTKAFLAGVPLVWPSSKMIPVTDDRICDINTPEDWTRAEQMYTALQVEK